MYRRLALLICMLTLAGGVLTGCSEEEQHKLSTNLTKLERDSRELEEATQKEENERGCTPSYCPPGS